MPPGHTRRIGDHPHGAFDDVPVAQVRAFWDRRPCNIRHSPREVGSREYFDDVERRKYRVEPHIPGFAEFPRWVDKRVLEIGCGIGTDAINFARAGAQVTAVDVSRESLGVARQRAKVFGLDERITFVEADAEQLETVVPPQPFDLVYSFGVLHHSPHPERIIAQIRDHYVRDGSTLKLMIYNRLSWKVLSLMTTTRTFADIDALVARHSEAQSGCPVTYTYKKSQVPGLLGSHFEIQDISIEHIFPYRTSDYIAYRYVKHWYFRVMPAWMFRRLEHMLGWHLCVTARARLASS